jgi:hypothetical protein
MAQSWFTRRGSTWKDSFYCTIVDSHEMELIGEIMKCLKKNVQKDWKTKGSTTQNKSWK